MKTVQAEREAKSRPPPRPTDVAATAGASSEGSVRSSIGPSALIYFALTGGAGTLAALGLHWRLPGSAVLLGTSGLAIALTVALERILPYRGAWQQSHDDVRTD